MAEIRRARQCFRDLALACDEIASRRTVFRMLAEKECRRKRIVQAELGVDRLRHLVRRHNLLPRPVGAGSQTNGKEKDQPIPIEDLSAEEQQEDRAAKRQHSRERSLMNEKVSQLAPPASPDQVVKCGPLIHLLIMTKKIKNRFALSAANLVKVLELLLNAHKDRGVTGKST